jgi:hypothetical protein
VTEPVKGAVEIYIEMKCVFVTIFTAKRGLVAYEKRTSVYATVCNAVVDSLLKKTDDHSSNHSLPIFAIISNND